MKKEDAHLKLYREMASPSFYPHPVSKVARKETHISVVFLTGDFVYKLKKPLDLGFLNFRSLSDRHHFCEQEIILNRRLSSGIYLDVVPIFRKPNGSFSLEGPGAIMEYAVKMRQLPDAAAFRNRLQARKMRRGLINALGKKLSAFYEKSASSPMIDRFGHRDIISANMEENFTQLSPFMGTVIDPEKWEFICQVSRTFLNLRSDLFEIRIASGLIRDGHGDLRTDHVYFYRGIQIIDCIEFNDRFRYGDVISDIAFLHMDMDHYGLPTWSLAFLKAYVEFSKDWQAYALVDFYAVYRAVVRLKVSCLSLSSAKPKKRNELIADARLYMDQAYRYAVQFGMPTIWMTCGLPASGKSALAQSIAEALALHRIQSDAVRKELFDKADEQIVPYDDGIYRSGMRDRVYAQMLAAAQDKLHAGESIMLDATFSRRKWREAARLLAHDLDANLICVECICRRETLRKRLKARKKGSGLSDARLMHLPKMTAEFEPVDEMPSDMHLKVNTDQDFEKSLNIALCEGYDLKCRQIKQRI